MSQRATISPCAPASFVSLSPLPPTPMQAEQGPLLAGVLQGRRPWKGCPEATSRCRRSPICGKTHDGPWVETPRVREAFTGAGVLGGVTAWIRKQHSKPGRAPVRRRRLSQHAFPRLGSATRRRGSRAVTAPCPAIYERTRSTSPAGTSACRGTGPVHAPSTNSNAVARTPSTRRYCARGFPMMSRDNVASVAGVPGRGGCS